MNYSLNLGARRLQHIFSFLMTPLIVFGAVFGTYDSVQAESSQLNIDIINLSDNRKLRIKMASEARCSLSDADAITSVMDHTYAVAKTFGTEDPNIDVYLSIEPVLEQEDIPVFAPLTRCVSCGDVSVKSGAVFSLPKVNGPVLAGVFICTATRKEGEEVSCREKEVANWKSLFRTYSITLNPKTGNGKLALSKTPPSDKIFFFRYLIIDRDGMFYTPTGMSPESYKALGELFSDSKKRGKVLAAVRNLGILASTPLKNLGSNTLELNLPHYNQKKCGH